MFVYLGLINYLNSIEGRRHLCEKSIMVEIKPRIKIYFNVLNIIKVRYSHETIMPKPHMFKL